MMSRRRFVPLGVVLVLILLAVTMCLLIASRSTNVRQLSKSDIEATVQDLQPDSRRAQIYRSLEDRGRLQLAAAPSPGAAFEGDTVRFMPPPGFTLRTHKKDEAAGKERAVFIAGQGGTRRLVVSSEPYNAQAIDEISAIKSRRLQPDLYEEAVPTVAGRQVLEFTRPAPDSYEKVIFDVSNNLVTTIAFTALTGFAVEAAEQEYPTILQSITWR